VTAPRAQPFADLFFLLSYPLLIQHAANLHINPHGKLTTDILCINH